MWITNALRAGLILLLARAEGRLTAFVLEKEPERAELPSLTISPPLAKLGYRGVETVELSFDAYRVADDSMLGGEEGQGLKQFMAALELGRVNIAVRAVGIAAAALDAALRYARERETFGKPIAEHQAVQLMLAQMATQIEAARQLTLHAARTKEADGRADLEAAMAKLFASESAAEVALDAMRIHGGYGYSPEFVVERIYRDAPLLIVGEGTNEIQQLVTARRLLERGGGPP
jgi:alkylation response protein AidB-like acyl-CoA dehydrogenase